MTGSIVPLPSAKGLAQARAWLDTKRAAHLATQTRRQQFMADLQEELSDTLGSLGIQKVVVGDQVLVDLGTAATPVPDQTRKWSDHLAQGGMLAILAVSSAGCGFFGDEKVNPNDRSLEELIDVNLVRTLAPKATLYGPQDTIPWEDYLPKYGFQLWVTDPAELDALWRALPQWVKTDWHDQTMANSKFFHKAESVFNICLTRVVAPDLPWRIGQARRAAQVAEQSEHMGAWDSQAQTSLKTALGALAAMENHPLLGERATHAIDELLPLLGYAMEGKARDKKLSKKAHAAWGEAREGLVVRQVKYSEWTPTGLPS